MFFWGPICTKRGHYGPWHILYFLVEITKPDHQLSETLYFVKISDVLTELWIFFYLEWCFFFFFSEKCHFQLKQLWTGHFHLIYSLVACISKDTQNNFEKNGADKMVSLRGYFLNYYFRYENKIKYLFYQILIFVIST